MGGSTATFTLPPSLRTMKRSALRLTSSESGPTERLVLVAAVIVEYRQVGLDEVAAIQHQIAGDLAHTVGAQITQQQPELLHVQLGIAATFQIKIAIEHAIHQRAVGIELGFPLMIRPEQFECGVGGDQFHGRGGIDRYVCIDDCRCRVAGKRQHDDRQRIVVDLVGLERLFHTRAASGSRRPHESAAQWEGQNGQGDTTKDSVHLRAPLSAHRAAGDSIRHAISHCTKGTIAGHYARPVEALCLYPISVAASQGLLQNKMASRCGGGSRSSPWHRVAVRVRAVITLKKDRSNGYQSFASPAQETLCR